MQCPACNHIPLAGNQPDPNACPKCGIEYSAAIRAKAQAAAAKPKPAIWPPPEFAAHVRQAMNDHRGATPAVIVDFEMGFGSMVRFLVKLAFAAIPAVIVIALVWVGILAILGGIGAALR